MASVSLLPYISKYKVSSVLNRDVTELGKQNLFDGSSETCWNSEQGTPQHILVEFKQPVFIHSVVVQFQGGFAGKTTRLIDGDSKAEICPLYPEDNNKKQTLTLPSQEHSVERQKLKLQFVNSTDFHGRVIVYSLDFRGSVAQQLDDPPSAIDATASTKDEPNDAPVLIIS
ncbi:Nuclear receptor 2C2-associated protein [Coemansia brasiliensis]|uniref:Nuclear receptor 2C2-associated protein n=1 Tax=Coemansia brasiliensis TaxID=2650707 RepID=A0A9W8LXV9_9FUNG|nr:Nuclear receptor 2C2-associated protein [Coemansia brasiliensis]